MLALLLLTLVVPVLAGDGLPVADAPAPDPPGPDLPASPATLVLAADVAGSPGHGPLAVATVGLVTTGVGAGLMGASRVAEAGVGKGEQESHASLVLYLLSVPALATGPMIATAGGILAADRLEAAGMSVSRIPGWLSVGCMAAMVVSGEVLALLPEEDDRAAQAAFPWLMAGLYGGAVAGGVAQYVVDVRATRRWRAERAAPAEAGSESGVVGPVLMPVIGPGGERGLGLALAF